MISARKIFCFLLMMTFSLSAKANENSLLPVRSFAPLVEVSMPMVVNISTTGVEREEDDLSDIENIRPDFFNKDSKNLALGSGFIVTEDGYIITNLHVINDATSIEVTLADNSKYDAKVVGKDEKTDIALIKIAANKKLPFARLGDSDAIKVGDWVLAIGNPFGLGGSVTTGIVSAKSRDIASGPYDNFIQTDASINQGNSGGPMLDLNGEVIGINSAMFSTNGASMGIGFAIPVNSIKWVVEQLKQNGVVKRGWIGIKIKSNSENAKQSVVITSLTNNGPAQKAGIKPGDVISKVNDLEIDNARQLSRLIAEARIGSQIRMEVVHNGVSESIDINVEEMPVDVPLPKPTEFVADIPVAPKQKQDAPITSAQFNIPDIFVNVVMSGSGLVVDNIAPGSEAERSGLKVGDVITHIDKKEVFLVEEAKAHIIDAKLENNRPVLLKVIREGGDVHFVALKLNVK